MARTISIGAQSFADIREREGFLVDKTSFISEWWLALDDVTLICRPRRFGKTLNLSMVECFFSTRYANRADLFDGLAVWDSPAMRAEQGRWPVVSISFATVKGQSFEGLQARLCGRIAQAYREHADEVDLSRVSEHERQIFLGEVAQVPPREAPDALTRLCEILYRQSGKRAIVLIDEYDTPFQEAWLDGCWDRMVALVRPLFNAAPKSNPYLGRALVTGITRVTCGPIFSDLNNLKVVTSTSPKYEAAFGLTQPEVDAAMDEFGLADRDGVRRWYDGFTFGTASDIYNPWSITNYLDKRVLAPYWANTSSNGLVSRLVSQADADLKGSFETLLEGGSVTEALDELISFPDLDYDPNAVWSLLAASGYLKIVSADEATGTYELAVTNHETMLAFDSMVRRWFARSRVAYNGFVRSPSKEASLEETVAAALAQIESRGYSRELLAAGVPPQRVRCYGFAFEGKRVLIGA